MSRRRTACDGATLSVRAGEIVGLAGLVGAGRTELARAIFGADRVVRGTVTLDGKPLRGGPVGSVRAGVGLVPENRKAEGLALTRSVQDNVLVAGLREAVSVRLVSSVEGDSRRHRGHRTPADCDAVARTADALSERRKPAESG